MWGTCLAGNFVFRLILGVNELDESSLDFKCHKIEMIP